MATRFRHAALVGKFNAEGIREELESVAAFLVAKGLAVTLEEDTALKTGIDGYPRLDASALGQACDIAVVVGGDGTMLGIARQLARHDTPLVGINQGRLGFITDIALGDFESALAPILAGDYDEEQRTMLEGEVERDGKTIFDERRPQRRRWSAAARPPAWSSCGSRSTASSSPSCAPTA